MGKSPWQAPDNWRLLIWRPFCYSSDMHLLIATGLYPPEIGGPATYAKLLEERLPALGIDVSVLPFSEVRHLASVIRHIVYAWKLALHSRKSDVILVQDTVSTGLPAALVSLIMRKPLIVRVPGDYAWEQGTQLFGVKDSLDEFQKHFYGVRVALLRLIQRFVVNRGARIITPSHYLSEIVSTWVPHTRHIDVVYNGVDLSSLASAPREVHLIVSSGRFVPWKGFSKLIEVVARHKDWRLVIIGDGPDRAKLETEIQMLGAGERIKLIGKVSHEEAKEWFARASVFVLNSRYEGLSHTLIEVMAHGTPVIATAVGGNPEVVQDEVNGMLFDAGNEAALERGLPLLLSDESLRSKLGDAARKRAKRFSIERTVEATARIVRELIEK